MALIYFPYQHFYNNAEAFQYAFLALPHETGMKKPLIRSWTTATSVSELNELHFFPYDTLHIIHSHIRPHFAVYNLGMKLSGIDNWSKMLFSKQYQRLTRQHRTLLTCIQQSMTLYDEWTREKPPSNFSPDSYVFGGSGGAYTGKRDNTGSASSRMGSKKSGQGSQRARKSDIGGSARGSGLADNKSEIYPDDSLTLVFEAAAEEDDDDSNEPPDDEHTDDENDECFYARLNTWVTSVPPGPPPSSSPAHRHAVPKKTTGCNTDSEDGSTTFVGVADSKTSMQVSSPDGLGALEKVGMLPSNFSLMVSYSNLFFSHGATNSVPSMKDA